MQMRQGTLYHPNRIVVSELSSLFTSRSPPTPPTPPPASHWYHATLSPLSFPPIWQTQCPQVHWNSMIFLLQYKVLVCLVIMKISSESVSLLLILIRTKMFLLIQYGLMSEGVLFGISWVVVIWKVIYILFLRYRVIKKG